MNWKRGALRLYVVLWAAWAVVSGVVAGSETADVLQAQATHRDWVRANFLTATARESSAEQEWWPRGAVLVVTDMYGVERRFPSATSDSAIGATFTREEAERTTRAVTRVLGQWAAVALLMPGGFFAAARWVWSGFEARPLAR